MTPEHEQRRVAVIDLGSNSFRLVVYTSLQGSWWKLTDEIFEPVRIGEGLEETGDLQPAPMERALETLKLYAHFCRATAMDEVRAVATSAIREAGNRQEFLAAVRDEAGLDVQVLSREEEARYGYLAAVNSTTLSDGISLDLGGGSMQLVHVERRQATDMRSWPLGAVRMTERFLPDGKAKPKRLKNLRAHVRDELRSAPWLAGDESCRRLVGLGGTVRNLASAVHTEEGLPTNGVQGYAVSEEALAALVERLADMPAAERGRVPGIKPARGDLILAGAVVV